MAKDAIVEKLRAQLSGADAARTECEVVYILCEVRKLLDQQTDRSTFPTLKLYCDWAMHVQLTYRNTIRPFLERIDQFFWDNFGPDSHGVSPQDHVQVQQLLYLDSFRVQLRDFLAQFGLPTGVCDDDKRWFGFLTAYAGVIEDGSLDYSGDDLKIINKMTFTKGPAPSDANLRSRIPFTILWTVALKNGNVFKMPLNPNWSLVGTCMYERCTPGA